MSEPNRPDPSAPPAPAGGPNRSIDRRAVLVAAVAGFLVAAGLAAVLVATGVIGDDSSASASTTPISLPRTVGDYQRFADTKANQNSTGRKIVKFRAADAKATAERLSAAHDGAAAEVQSYASGNLLTQFSVWAVRDATPPPVLPVASAAETGLAVPQREVRRFGAVSCELFSIQAVPQGKTPPPHNQAATDCQRSDDGLTVIIVGGGATGVFTDPPRVAALVNEVWDGLH